VLSARADEQRELCQGEDLGIVEWLGKPADSEQLLAAVNRAMSRVRRRPRVLHVEDDPMMLQTAASALHEHADVTAARSLAEARAALERESFELAILDIGMPDGSGLDLVPHLKDARGGLPPVILFSGKLGDASQDGGSDNVSLRLSKTKAGWVRALGRTVKGLGDQRVESQVLLRNP
jgi:DNA-binding response OmpR family regulator